jgi:hypothetical protein
MPFGSPIQEEAPPAFIPPDTGLSTSPENGTFQNTTSRHTRPHIDSLKLLPLDSTSSSDRQEEAPQISSKRSSRQGKWWSRKVKGTKEPERLSPLDAQSRREDSFLASTNSSVFSASAVQRYHSEAPQISAFFDDNESDDEGGVLKSLESTSGGRTLYQSRSVSNLLDVPEARVDNRAPSKPRLSLLTKPLRKVKAKTQNPAPLPASPLDVSPWEQALSEEVEREAAAASNSRRLGSTAQLTQGSTGLPSVSIKAHRRQTSPTIGLHGSMSVTDLRSPTYEGLSPAGVPPSQGEQHRYHYTKSSPMSGTEQSLAVRPIIAITKASSDSATIGTVHSRTGEFNSEAGSRESHEDRRSVETMDTVANVFTKPKGAKKSRLAFVEKALLSMSGGAAHYVPDVPAGRKGPGVPRDSVAYAM